MTTAEITKPLEPQKPRTTFDNLRSVISTASKDIATKATLLKGTDKEKNFYFFLEQLYSHRKEQYERAAKICEKPSVQKLFQSLAKSNSLHNTRHEKLLKLIGTKNARVKISTKVFQDYWNKINFANELEFVGAVYALHIFEKLSYLPDEFHDSYEKLKWASREEKEMENHLESLAEEFSTICEERILAGATHGTHYLQGLFDEVFK